VSLMINYMLLAIVHKYILHRNIDQTLGNTLYRLLNCEIGEIDGRVITTKYRTNLFFNVLVIVIYSRLSGQYSHAITYFVLTVLI